MISRKNSIFCAENFKRENILFAGFPPQVKWVKKYANNLFSSFSAENSHFCTEFSYFARVFLLHISCRKRNFLMYSLEFCVSLLYESFLKSWKMTKKNAIIFIQVFINFAFASATVYFSENAYKFFWNSILHYYVPRSRSFWMRVYVYKMNTRLQTFA